MSVDLINENGFILKKTKSRYLIETMTDADYTDDLLLLITRSAHTEFPLYSLEQAAGLN